MTFGSKLPEAGDTGIIVGGAVEFAGAHGGQWGSPSRRKQERWHGRWAGLVLSTQMFARWMNEQVVLLGGGEITRRDISARSSGYLEGTLSVSPTLQHGRKPLRSEEGGELIPTMKELVEKGRWPPWRMRAVRPSHSFALGVVVLREGPAAGLT